MQPLPERILIWGGGGHGKVVADLVRALGHTVIGFVDRDPRKLGQVVEPGGAAVILSEADMLQAVEAGSIQSTGAGGVAAAIGDNAMRSRCRGRLGTLNCPALVHPVATVSPSVEIGAGSVVFAAAVINAAAVIGAGVIVNTGAVVEHDCRIGDDAHVSPGVVIAGGAEVGPLAWIGAGAVVLPGVKIGAGAIVGAGAVVTRDVLEGQTVMGVPAKNRGQSR